MLLKEEHLRNLLLGGLAGQASAYHQFLSELSAHLRFFLRRRLAALPNDVEDLVQELLMAIHNCRHTYDPGQPVTAWIHAIARYKLIDLLRRRARTDLLNDPLDPSDELFSGSDTAAVEAHYDLTKLLQVLPDRQRLPIVHVKIEGNSVADTALRTGMAESAVKIGIHRGLKALAAKVRGLA
jgi:RNA polymerase sigma-70 factor (ECF subfamily)